MSGEREPYGADDQGVIESWVKRSRDGRPSGGTYDIMARGVRARRVAAMVVESDADAIIQGLAALERALKISGRVVNTWLTAGRDVCCVCGDLPDSGQHDEPCWVPQAQAALAALRVGQVGGAS